MLTKEIKETINKKTKHISFIVDGNGRWAKQRGLPRSAGHNQGLKTLEKIVKNCFYDFNIPIVSAFVFSTENWSRPQNEVNYLMNLFRNYLNKNFQQKYPNVKFNMLGSYNNLPQDIILKIEELKEATKNNKPYIYNLALNYGGHNEIVEAVNSIIDEGVHNVTEVSFENYLKTKGQPPIDIVIRTSGEQRISNFMLWQMAYAELFFTKTYWPDFSTNELENILVEFTNKNRRFGGLQNEGNSK